MARKPKGRAKRGSQFWLQTLVNERPHLLNERIDEANGAGRDIEWVSPLADDDYAEYEGDTFLERLGIQPQHRSLKDFWPVGGPNWDALGRTGTGGVYLVEAKSYIGEVNSSPSGALALSSVALIERSLAETRRFLGSRGQHDWSRVFYQYTNRLAHLYFLRQLNLIPAWLVFVYFLNDREMGGPATRERWEGAIELLQCVLDIRGHPLQDFVVDVFLDVSSVAEVSSPDDAMERS